MSLPGIGPELSDRIVEARDFASVDDVSRVKGIGPKTIEDLRPLVEARGG
ncbi:Helix-hairpin-helix motif protein [Tautonia plasticadhaerens]|uniref:Helix-hairpin-helix motif protein n=2 Tax=Tautonia plasticadhaerens TaxID=2527974 RepID=A0A518HDX8_9BACT|nr:Helix-hairpin-helix motif protein [Tautonia plasticadhaerens]